MVFATTIHASATAGATTQHAADAQLRRTIAAATAGDASGFKSQLTKLARVAPPLNHNFDAVGLQDCGSRQQ